MVLFKHIPSPENVSGTRIIAFSSHDEPLNKELSPLYILTQINGNVVTRILVDLTNQVNVIIEETFFIND